MIPSHFRSVLLCPLVVTTFCVRATNAEQLLVSSFLSDRVGRYAAERGDYLNMLEGHGLDGPLSARIGPDDLLYVTSEGTNQVKRYNWRTATLSTILSRRAPEV